MIVNLFFCCSFKRLNLKKIFTSLTVTTASNSVSPSHTVNHWKMRLTLRRWAQFVLLNISSLEIMNCSDNLYRVTESPNLWLGKVHSRGAQRAKINLYYWIQLFGCKWKEICSIEILLFSSSVVSKLKKSESSSRKRERNWHRKRLIERLMWTLTQPSVVKRGKLLKNRKGR